MEANPIDTVSSVHEKKTQVVQESDPNIENGHLKDLEVDLSEILEKHDGAETEGNYEDDHSPFAEG